VQAVLGHLHRDLGQLGDLVAGGLAGLLISLGEAVPTAAARRPVVHHPVDRLGRQELSPLAPVVGLGALCSPGRIGALALGRSRRVLTRRGRGVMRVAVQAPLELCDLLTLLGDLSGQLLDLLVHPQQDRYDGLTALVIDRFGLGALHAEEFVGRRLCPPGRLNGYRFCEPHTT
jgi:hypothetical protein